MLRDSRSYEAQIIDAVRSVNKALGGTYGTSSAIHKNEFNQYEVQLIDAIKGIGRTLSGHGLSLVGGGVGEVTASQFQELSQRVSKLESESFFRLVNGNVTLKQEYQNLWVPGWLAAGGIGSESGGGQYTAGAGIDITNNVISLLPASASSLGGVKVDGTTITIDGNGVISSVGGSPFNGGEITNDLWLHTNSANYGSTLFFGDKDGNTGYVYIKEDSEDHLTIYGYEGVTITTNGHSSVVIEDLSVALGELSNVELTNLSDGQGIVWDDTNQVWKNATIGGGGGSYYAGTGISINSSNYISIKTASTSQLGGVKVDGTTITISNGVISAVGGSGGSTVSWGSSGSDYVYLSVDGTSKKLLTEHQDLSGYVTLATTQTITGAKTFTTNPVTIGSDSGLSVHQSSYIDLGPVRIKFENNALHITKKDSSDTNNYGIYADGFVSAGGVGTSS